MDRSVIRLSHCQKEIFCFSVPEECPSCGEELKGSRLQEAPVSLPSPFTNGHKTSCCLLVAPALDNINRDFNGTSDLHTGISNTTGENLQPHLVQHRSENNQEV
ncbi:MKRN2 opposite strand protein-like [Cheilinus undulatus]|uniref:MKRN2 opposite strand protein-like n=1 Tax=Cheilinus undulatus TaxID=241271 RepID=UPI001BD64B22|nr:MKRN2 opposite strand protein-like [Cheilinus undulatus]